MRRSYEALAIQYALPALGRVPRRDVAHPLGSPDDEGSLAAEIAGEPEERAYLLSKGFDPAVVEAMLKKDRAGAPLNRDPKGMLNRDPKGMRKKHGLNHRGG